MSWTYDLGCPTVSVSLRRQAIAGLLSGTFRRLSPMLNRWTFALLTLIGLSARVILAADATAPQSQKVLLGSPELTAGIPGKGPVTTKELEAWLAKPENHV